MVLVYGPRLIQSETPSRLNQSRGSLSEALTRSRAFAVVPRRSGPRAGPRGPTRTGPQSQAAARPGRQVTCLSEALARSPPSAVVPRRALPRAGPRGPTRPGTEPQSQEHRAREASHVTVPSCPNGSPAAVAHWQWHAGQLSSWPRGISSRLILEQNVTR